MAVADLPTYGYRRVWALLRRESERDGLPVVALLQIVGGDKLIIPFC